MDVPRTGFLDSSIDQKAAERVDAETFALASGGDKARQQPRKSPLLANMSSTTKPKPKFGPIGQLGFVVKDIQAAMRHWSEVNGVGPWFFIPAYPLPTFRYKGVEGPGPDVSIALGYSGDMQIELIEQRCRTPSMYRDFIDSGMEGLQHYAVWCENYDATLNEALEAGFKIGQEGDATGRGRFAYLESTGHPGTVVELVELTESRKAGFDRMKAAAANWDGSDPIRLL